MAALEATLTTAESTLWNVRFGSLADINTSTEKGPLLGVKRTFKGFPKITFLISGEMSAWGGKADFFIAR